MSLRQKLFAQEGDTMRMFAVKAEIFCFVQSDRGSGLPRTSVSKHSTKPQSFALKSCLSVF